MLNVCKTMLIYIPLEERNKKGSYLFVVGNLVFAMASKIFLIELELLADFYILKMDTK